MMLIHMMKSKIHRATITDSDLHYIGSITIDPDLMEAANILPNERVTILDIDNGNRFDTYVLASQRRGEGEITLNGAAARLVHRGDLIIIITYCIMDEKEAKSFKPLIIHVDKKNKIIDL